MTGAGSEMCKCGRIATHAELSSDRTMVVAIICGECAHGLRRRGEPRPVRIGSGADPRVPRDGKREFREG